VRDAEEMLPFNQRSSLRTSKGRNAFDWSVAVDRQVRHVAQQPVDQAVEELVSASDMPVDRGDRHPELLSERTHREGIDPVAFDELSRSSSGYRATIVNGVVTRRDGVDTGARPGRLVRGAR
jgi:hypothetical protein